MHDVDSLFFDESAIADQNLPYPFLRTREDGYPICPKCGEDELYHFAQSGDGEKPELLNLALTPRQSIEAGVTCFSCGWSNHIAGRVAVVQSDKQVVVTRMPHIYPENVVHISRKRLGSC